MQRRMPILCSHLIARARACAHMHAHARTHAHTHARTRHYFREIPADAAIEPRHTLGLVRISVSPENPDSERRGATRYLRRSHRKTSRRGAPLGSPPRGRQALLAVCRWHAPRRFFLKNVLGWREIRALRSMTNDDIKANISDWTVVNEWLLDRARSTSASPTTCLFRRCRRAGTQNDRLGFRAFQRCAAHAQRMSVHMPVCMSAHVSDR